MKFNSGDLVDVQGRKLVAYGEITKIEGTKAVVHFNDPVLAQSCARCGFPKLSLHICADGQIGCGHCGHEHGFEDRDEIIEISKLINITEKRAAEKLAGATAAFKSGLDSLLYVACRDGVITAGQSEQINSIAGFEEKKKAS